MFEVDGLVEVYQKIAAEAERVAQYEKARADAAEAKVARLVEALQDIWAMCADHANDPDHYNVRGWVEVCARTTLVEAGK